MGLEPALLKVNDIAMLGKYCRTQYYQMDSFGQIGDFTFKTAMFLKGPN